MTADDGDPELTALASEVARRIWHAVAAGNGSIVPALMKIKLIAPGARFVVDELVRRGVKTVKFQTSPEHRVFSSAFPAAWGPTFWRFMHVAADRPGTDKRALRAFILQLQNVLPCVACRMHWRDALKASPPADLDRLSQWLSARHAEVTARTTGGAGMR